MSGFVYFVLDATSGAVKIGYGTDPAGRFTSICVGNPNPLELCASVPGTMEDERALHRALKRWPRPLSGRAFNGEWFHWNLITHEIIDRAQADAPIGELIDFAEGKLFTPLQHEAGRLISHIEESVHG